MHAARRPRRDRSEGIAVEETPSLLVDGRYGDVDAPIAWRLTWSALIQAGSNMKRGPEFSSGGITTCVVHET